MAIQYNTYVTDGLTRTYPSTKHIATKSHCSVLVKNTLTLLWEVVSVELYSLVNNSIIFEDAVATSLYSNIEIRVADTQDELISSESDIAIVASNITNINIDATNIIPITTVATNIGSVQTTSGSIANVNTVSGSIANVNSTGSNIISVNTNATNISDIVSVATTVVPNIAEILLADDNATTATTQAGVATTQATLSTNSATEAEHWANYTTDVAVPEGTGEFSAKHYAAKAAASAASLDLTMTIGNINSPLLDMPLNNSLAMKSGVGSATFTRASTATYIDRYGVLKSSAIDEPRFEKEGYLNEGSSTNLLTYSEQFDNAVWVKARATISANTTETLDPYGTNLSDKFIEDTSNNTHQNVYSFSASLGVAYTKTVFVKAGTRSQIYIGFSGAGMPTLSFGYFDVLNGTILSFGANGICSISPLANGWYRCSLTATAIATATANTALLLANNGTNVYLGDGTSGLYIFGAQLEALPFASSYIPTVASTVTRAADSLTVTSLNNISKSILAKTHIMDMDILGHISWLTQVLLATDIDTNAIYSSRHTVGNLLTSAYSATALSLTTTPPTVNTKYRVAVSNDNANSSNAAVLYGYINGVQTVTGTRIAAAIGQATTIYIGRTTALTNNHYGHISNVKLYAEKLTAQEVALA